MTGSVAVLLLTTYLAHGISRQTSLALLATLIALLLTAGPAPGRGRLAVLMRASLMATVSCAWTSRAARLI